MVNVIGFPYTVKPQYNEGPRDWQHLFAIAAFFFMYFTITAGKKNRLFYLGLGIQKFVIHRGSIEPIEWIVIYPLDSAIRGGPGL